MSEIIVGVASCISNELTRCKHPKKEGPYGISLERNGKMDNVEIKLITFVIRTASIRSMFPILFYSIVNVKLR